MRQINRVLHIISSLDPAAGGVSQALRTMIRGLTSLSVENEVASIDAPDATYLKGELFKVYPLGAGKTAWQYAPALTEWLIQHIAEYDVVIVHALWQYQTYAVRKAFDEAKATNTALFVMPHGMLDPYFQKAKGRKLKAIRNNIFWQWNERKIINKADGLLFTCETERLLAKEPFSPYHPKSEHVVGLGVDQPPAYNAIMKVAFDEKIGKSLRAFWLFISRIHEKKGVDLLIKSYLELKNEGNLLPPLVIAGPGLDTEYGEQMKLLAAQENDIYFPGMLSGDAKWGAFYGCQVFILPSHQENFGIAVVEAQACNKPVLISDQVNIWREVTSEGGGLADKDTMDGVKNLLIRWSNAGVEEQQRFAAHARCSFDKYFTVDAAAQTLLKAISPKN